MKTALGLLRVCLHVMVFAVVVILSFPCDAEPLTLKHAVQLALAHSPASAQAAADEQRAFASYREARNEYFPQVMVGSGLGDTWGYPLSLEGSAPSLVNVTAQSALFNPALREFVRAAHHEFQAIQEETIDRRSQITQDTVLTYVELVKWQKEINQLRRQYEDEQNMEGVEKQRVQAGVDSEQAGKQAELAAARAYLRVTQAEGAMDVLKQNLSQLTGVPVNSIETDPDSVPGLPELPPDTNEVAKAEQSSPSVLFAQDHAIAQTFRARGEHRSLWPSADFATQYAVLAKFNNWLQFFPQAGAFERNNATVGVVIRFPFFNPSQRAHAQAADAEAMTAAKAVQATKNQVSQQTLKLRRSVEQLQAAQKVNELEYEIAQSNVQALEIKMTSGTATIVEGAQARADMSEKYNALEDANFDLLRARIDLMRVTGDLDSWVDQGK